MLTDLTNVATVTALDGGGGGGAVTDSDSAFVKVFPDQLDATKEAESEVVFTGQSATFTITIRNIGGGTLTNISVDDPLPPSCDRAVGSLPDLGPGEETFYTCLTGPLFANLNNVATVSAEVGGGGGPAALSTASTPAGPIQVVAVAAALVLVVDPDLGITKTASPSAIQKGLNTLFTITLTNNSTQTLSSLTVSDPLTPTCDRAVGPLPDLASGASISYTCQSLMVLGPFTNIATVTAQTPAGDPLMSSAADVTVLILNESIPTLSDLGLLIQLLLLGASGYFLLRRKLKVG